MFAQIHLDLMKSGKRILNIDQSALNESAYAEKAWMLKNVRATKHLKPIKPRVTMIAGIENYGEVYYSLM